MLEVDVIRAEDLLNLRIDERCLACVPFLLLSLRYLFDADVDHIRRCHPGLHPVVLEGIENAPVVVLDAKQLVERDDGLFLAQFLQNKDR